MDKEKAKELLAKYRAGTLTGEERALLESWYLDLPTDDELDLSEAELQDELQRVRAGIPYLYRDKRPTHLWPRISAAAAVLLLLSTGLYYVLRQNQPAQQTAQVQRNDIAPGGSRAILRSGNRSINVSDAKNGLLAQQGNISIDKTADGRLVYHNNGAQRGNIVYDTLITPRGGQFQLKMADGTIALLNADTKMRYPESFMGKERIVELLSGEAYFSVKHDAGMPFKVMIKGQVVNDIGTKFNISAYDDESAITTTLIEGSVKIIAGDKNFILKPGQETIFRQNDLTVADANTEEAIAWTNGYFRFSNESIQGIMRQLSRWYNIDVFHQGDVTTDRLNGKISRYKNISQVLQMLEATKLVHFNIEGRRVTVMQ